MIIISPISPLELPNTELEEMVCKVLSLTGDDGHPDNLEACVCFKKIENVIVKFKSRNLKYIVISYWKRFREMKIRKFKELKELKLTNNL